MDGRIKPIKYIEISFTDLNISISRGDIAGLFIKPKTHKGLGRIERTGLGAMPVNLLLFHNDEGGFRNKVGRIYIYSSYLTENEG